MLQRILICVSLLAVSAGSIGAAQAPTDEPVAPIDINSASLEEIQGVVVDEMLARQIIDGRPYANKRQLLTRDLVTEEEYDRIKDRIIARRPATPR